MLPNLPNYFISSLAQTLTVGGNDTSIALSTIYTQDGQEVTTADLGQFGRCILTINPVSLSSVEFASGTGFTLGTPPAGTVTGTLRGLSFKNNTQIPANQKYNPVGTPVLISFGTHNIIDIMTIINNNYATLVALIDAIVINEGVPASATVMGISRLTANPSVDIGTATITIASPAVITHNSHGLTVNDIVQFTTTGALPTGILASTPYYVLSSGLTTNSFEISATPGGAAINTSGTQSGTHTLFKVTPIAQAALSSGEVSALVGNNIDVAVGSGNKYVTQTGLIHNAEKYAVDTGTADVYTIALSPIPTSLTDGMEVYAKIVHANATTTPTLNVNGLGAKTIVRLNNLALAAGDIAANMFCTFIYDLTNTEWVLQNPTVISSPTGSYVSALTSLPSITTSTNTDNAFTCGFVPNVITLYYSIQAYGGTTPFNMSGIAVFDGNGTLKVNFGTLNQAGTTPATNNNLSNLNQTPKAGTDNSNSSIALSIVSITTTGFTVRATTLIGDASYPASGSFSVVALH